MQIIIQDDDDKHTIERLKVKAFEEIQDLVFSKCFLIFSLGINTNFPSNSFCSFHFIGIKNKYPISLILS